MGYNFESELMFNNCLVMERGMSQLGFSGTVNNSEYQNAH